MCLSRKWALVNLGAFAEGPRAETGSYLDASFKLCHNLLSSRVLQRNKRMKTPGTLSAERGAKRHHR